MLKGDSITALTLADTKRFGGDLVGPASMIFILQSVSLGVVVTAVEIVSGINNWRADMLSRGKAIDDVAAFDESLLGVPVVDLEIITLLSVCDPRQRLDCDAQFLQFWQKIQSVVRGYHYYREGLVGRVAVLFQA